MVNWTSNENVLLLNPRMPSEDTAIFRSAFEQSSLTGHVWLTSSGSSGELKLVALSKAALLASAEAVNRHLQSDPSDVWLNPLPEFHVGGLGINARAFLSGASSLGFSERWNPHRFTKALIETSATLTSLVPTQVYDLVTQGLEAPDRLRAVIVGGGAISEHLYLKAVALGWKLLPSYGMTECSSQVATAKLDSWDEGRLPLMYPLLHVQVKLNAKGFLMIKSQALLTGYFLCRQGECCWQNPIQDQWFTTEDKVVFSGNAIRSVSRDSDFIKIGGESVNMLRLEKILEEERMALSFPYDCALISRQDARLGQSVHLAVAHPEIDVCTQLVERFKLRVAPYEQIRQVHPVPQIPRSPLNKVLVAEL